MCTTESCLPDHASKQSRMVRGNARFVMAAGCQLLQVTAAMEVQQTTAVMSTRR
jgi:hypothetical protein